MTTLCLASVGPGVLAAQGAEWSVGAEIAASRISSGAKAVGDDVSEGTVGAYRPTTVGIRLERRTDALGLALAVRYARPALALVADDATILDNENHFTLYEISPEVSMRVAGRTGGASVRVHGGPVLDIWSWGLADTQTRPGLRGGAALEMPLGGRAAATIGAATTFSGSMFAADDVGPEFERRSGFRTEIGVGLRYRLR